MPHVPTSFLDHLVALNEADSVYPAPKPTGFAVDYYVQTPRGSRSRFQRRASLAQLPSNAMSETAVYFFLKQQHPGTDITIISLTFV